MKDHSHHSHSTKFKTIHVRDSEKTVQIRDAFDNLRYDVTMYSEELEPLKTKYTIFIVNYFSGAPEPIVIDIDETEDYDKAMKIFDETVVNYSSLVRAETKDYRDIEIFKEKIGYQMTCPECCGTCKFSNRCIEHHTGEDIMNAKLRCTNEENIREFGFDVDVPEHHERHSHFLGEVPQHMSHKDRNGKVIEPKVSIFGKCKRYEKIGHK